MRESFFSFQNETFICQGNCKLPTPPRRFSKFRELPLEAQHQLPHPKLWRAMNFIREQRSVQPGQEVALLRKIGSWPSSHSLQSYGQFPRGHKNEDFQQHPSLCPITFPPPPQPHLLLLEGITLLERSTDGAKELKQNRAKDPSGGWLRHTWPVLAQMMCPVEPFTKRSSPWRHRQTLSRGQAHGHHDMTEIKVNYITCHH